MAKILAFLMVVIIAIVVLELVPKFERDSVAIKTAANADATSGSPVLIPFRDATLANGDPVISSLQAALSITVASTNTLGTSSGNLAFHLWVIAYYNGGTPAVGLFNASTATQIFGLSEGDLVSTAASTNGGNSAGTHYANVSTITNTPYRILGYLEWGSGLATAGTWASAPTKIVLFGPGVHKPGDVVQVVAPNFGTLTIVNFTTLAATNVTANITPTSAANLIRYFASVSVANTGDGSPSQAQMYRGTTAIGGVSRSAQAAASAQSGPNVSFMGIDFPGATSTQTYVIKGTAISGTGAIPAVNTDSATEILEEIMGALDEPANDNGSSELRMVG